MPRAACWLLLALAVFASAAYPRSKKVVAIDRYCDQLKQDFRETVPLIFSGPDPWVQVEDIDAAASDELFAYVYAQGPAIRWVFLQLNGPKDQWTEAVHYFFRGDGSIAKRERFVQSVPLNVELEVTTYYERGAVLKQHSHHHALSHGREDTSQFQDPDAPEFLTTDDLPFPDSADYWNRLAVLNPAPGQYPTAGRLNPRALSRVEPALE